MPGLQLALVGSMALDDPEGWEIYNSTLAHAAGDADIHFLNNLTNVGTIEVNAFQRWPTWSSRSRCARASGWSSRRRSGRAARSSAATSAGIPLQVTDGVTGYLVNSIEACASALP